MSNSGTLAGGGGGGSSKRRLRTHTARLIGCESSPVELPMSMDACVNSPPRGESSGSVTGRKAEPETPSIP